MNTAKLVSTYNFRVLDSFKHANLITFYWSFWYFNYILLSPRHQMTYFPHVKLDAISNSWRHRYRASVLIVKAMAMHTKSYKICISIEGLILQNKYHINQQILTLTLILRNRKWLTFPLYNRARPACA